MLAMPCLHQLLHHFIAGDALRKLRWRPGRRNNITLQRNYVSICKKPSKINDLQVTARRVRMGQGGVTSYMCTASTRD